MTPTYDPETHTSRHADGTEVPHVTRVLAEVGVATDFEELADGWPRLANAIEHARLRGTAVHADCHAYDDGDLLIETVHADVLPYLEAWMEARKNLKLVPKQRERYLHHPLYDYAGFMDGLFTDGQEGLADILADIKTGDPEHAAAHLQTAAYEAAHTVNVIPTDDDFFGLRRWAIWLRPGRRVPYTVIDYTREGRPHWEDFPKFAACLTVYREQAVRRPRL